MTTEPHDQRSGVGRRLANNARGDAGPFCDASKLGNTGSCSCTKGIKIRSATMRRLCQQRVPNQQASNRSRDAKPRKPFIVIKRRPGFEHVPEEDPHGGRCGPGNGSCPSGQATKGNCRRSRGQAADLSRVRKRPSLRIRRLRRQVTNDRGDGLRHRHASGVDDERLGIPCVVLPFEHALPCRQLVAGNIGLSSLDPRTVHG